MNTIDHPNCRSLTFCPRCGADKDQGLVLCWPCHRKTKNDQEYGRILDIFEAIISGNEVYYRQFGAR